MKLQILSLQINFEKLDDTFGWILPFSQNKKLPFNYDHITSLEQIFLDNNFRTIYYLYNLERRFNDIKFDISYILGLESSISCFKSNMYNCVVESYFLHEELIQESKKSLLKAISRIASKRSFESIEISISKTCTSNSFVSIFNIIKLEVQNRMNQYQTLSAKPLSIANGTIENLNDYIMTTVKKASENNKKSRKNILLEANNALTFAKQKLVCSVTSETITPKFTI